MLLFFTYLIVAHLHVVPANGVQLTAARPTVVTTLHVPAPRPLATFTIRQD